MIDPTKEYKTRSGLPVRIYAVDCGGVYCIHGAYFATDKWLGATWKADGRSVGTSHDSPSDLIEVREPIEGWVNVYPDGGSFFYASKEVADKHATHSPERCVFVREVDQ